MPVGYHTTRSPPGVQTISSIDVTSFLLARGADPVRPCNGVPMVAEAEARGHWLAAEVMRAWIGRVSQP